MLNPFPIQWLALFAYFILRSVVGTILLWLGITHWRNREAIAATTRVPFFPFPNTSLVLLVLTELVAGLSLLLGFYTQIGALLLIILFVKMLVWKNRFPHPSIPPRLTFYLLLGCGLSLFITGAGALAFDLPI